MSSGKGAPGHTAHAAVCASGRLPQCVVEGHVAAAAVPAVTVLNAGDNGSALSMTNAGSVNLLDLTLTGGDASGNCGANGKGCGGGIYAVDTALTIERLILTGNVASQTGEGWGGGLYAYDTGLAYTTTVLDSIILSNTASAHVASPGSGGAVYVHYGSFVMLDCEIEDNLGGPSNGAGYGA